MFQSKDLNVYFICGTQDIPEGRTIQEVLKEALEGGITLYQFREKGNGAKTGQDKVALAKELQALCKSYNVPFIVNDDVALAEEVDADGIHVGQDDEAVDDFNNRFEGKIIGLSIGNLEELNASDLTYVDYIGVGPIFATPSKDDASEPVGPKMIETLRKEVGDLLIVAIGGISLDNVQEVAKTSADGVSVISAIARSPHVTETVHKFLQYFK
ncbi:thiamine phosphate synthase [Staphylococcus carnosus]|uniref:Thiamine-phosphate synthase n=1 Tax=Staphylococcus carnosus TaxID=1281 RepID=A0AAJ0NG46_STACA|nr:thiamine phosphate synthase [Staphylococcus carnosus]KKB24523.1 thiamine-phosphate pyrophosphorylase [Staphylococcus carnosus]POA03112.1 thiamine phosphate synthase [Staphylococcus carnosus]QQS84780.1 thiamine phosphate synthase [Staphylococcus carnosus]QRQ04718.1 thiamine phosphate synthase [Staphylococcus carnosus]UTB83284.1 thiamine-phosphate diphosphorylase [Staphylococcus carnosus]